VGADPLVLNARLLASDATIPLGPASVSGPTIVAFGTAYVGGRVQDVVYVFTRPTGGWSDTARPAAMLVASDGGGLSRPVAISGSTVVAGDEHVVGHADVFTEPAGGWSGTVHESARLIASDAPKSGGLAGWAIDGRAIVAGSYSSFSSGSPGEAYVFTEPAGGWSGTLLESAKLFASASQAGDGFGSQMAISGQTIAVGAPSAGSAPARPGGGKVYVFTEPPGGWSGRRHEQATLSASNGSVDLAPIFGQSAIAVSGNRVFATAEAPRPGGGGVGEVYVFSAAAAGWSGAIHETHVLSSSDSSLTSLDPLTVSGGTLVAGPYVFTKPAGGWSGTIHESATLTIPNASFPCFGGHDSVAIDGATIAVACEHNAYVFTEPTGGWAGTIQPSATLLPPSTKTTFAESVAVLGSTIAVASGGGNTTVDPVGFNEPARGWSGTIRPTARLKLTPASADALDEYVVGSGDTIATLVVREDPICEGSPCTATLYAFRRPFGGWNETITGPSTDAFPSASGVNGFPFVFATDQGTIAIDGERGVDLLTIKPGPPSAIKVSLSGLATGRPKLRFTLDAGQSAAPIHKLQLTLPRGPAVPPPTSRSAHQRGRRAGETPRWHAHRNPPSAEPKRGDHDRWSRHQRTQVVGRRDTTHSQLQPHSPPQAHPRNPHTLQSHGRHRPTHEPHS